MTSHQSRPTAATAGTPVAAQSRTVPARRRRRIAILAALFTLLAGTALGALAAPAPARAHAELVRTSPAQGQTHQRSPERIQLQFTEPVTIPVEGVRLLDSRGEPVRVGVPAHPPGDRTTVDVPLRDALPEGGYTVAWRVTSTDSHPVSGAFTFTVGTAGALDAATDPAPGVESSGSRAAATYGVIRWIGFAALALLVGVAFFTAYAWPAGAARRGVRRLLWLGWATSIGSGAAAFLAYGPYVADLPLGRAFDGAVLATTLDTRLGVALIARIVLLLLLIPALVLLPGRLAASAHAGAATGPAGQRRVPRTATGPAVPWLVPPGLAVLVVGAGLAVTWGLANHSAAGEHRGWALIADVIHLVAMAVWLGGLAVLAGVLLPGRDVPALRTALPAFSRSAQASVGLLVVTGTFQLWRQVGGLPALLETSYGRLLLAKLSLVLVLLAMGTLARSWVRKHYPERPSTAAPPTRRFAAFTVDRAVLDGVPEARTETPAVKAGASAVKAGASTVKAGASAVKAGASTVKAGASTVKAGASAVKVGASAGGRVGARTTGATKTTAVRTGAPASLPTGSGKGATVRPPRRGAPADPDPHQLYHFGRRISLELLLGLAILGLTAALVATPPARTAHADRQAGAPSGVAGPGGGGPAAGPATSADPNRPADLDRGPIPFDAGAGPSAEGLLLFDLLPRRVGQATAHVSILDPAGQPKEVAEVRVALRLAERDLGPLDVPLRAAGTGHYLGTITVPLAGEWEAAVTVRTSEVDQTTVRIPLPVSG